MKSSLVDINNITKYYHTKSSEIETIKDFSFQVSRGDFIAIVGPSGCGKSTLLSILMGLEDVSSGSIKLNDISIDKFGYMLQKDHLFPWLNVLDNCLLGLKIKKICTKENIDYTKSLLVSYGLKDFMKSYPKELSGGMRQRAALIRTLSLKPEILLLDEPFSALDYQTRLAVSDDMTHIIRKEKKTMILVTHDLSEAVSMTNKIIVLTKRPATIKNVYEINLTCDSNSVIERRKAVEFADYYEKIWKDLDVHV